MQIENQVCKPDQAKRLKELGIVQDGYFICNCESGKMWYRHPNDKKPISKNQAVTFTSAELGLMLPEYLPFDNEYRLNQWRNPQFKNNEHRLSYDKEDYDGHACDRLPSGAEGRLSDGIIDYQEAWARAALVIWLIENKYESVQDINQRLCAVH
jgi:hypothetical protein